MALPVRKPETTQGAEKVTGTKQRAKGFLNWSIMMPDGTNIRGDKGFPIFQNPKYPSPKEDLLLDMAKANDGAIKMVMEVEVRLNSNEAVKSADDLVAELLAMQATG